MTKTGWVGEVRAMSISGRKNNKVTTGNMRDVTA